MLEHRGSDVITVPMVPHLPIWKLSQTGPILTYSILWSAVAYYANFTSNLFRRGSHTDWSLRRSHTGPTVHTLRKWSNTWTTLNDQSLWKLLYTMPTLTDWSLVKGSQTGPTLTNGSLLKWSHTGPHLPIGLLGSGRIFCPHLPIGLLWSGRILGHTYRLVSWEVVA